jgi:hypothetical protein
MQFRAVQGLTIATILGWWAVRALTHPGFHPMMLVMAALALGISELSYRAGKAKGTSSWARREP